MECQECHERPATLHFKQVVNGEKRELSLCEVCAKQKGYMTYPEEGYTLHDLLTGLFNFDSIKMTHSAGNQLKQLEELQCPGCSMKFSEFKQAGKFGCAQCYETFSTRLEPIFRRVHAGNTRHYGKIPKRAGGDLHIRKQLNSYKEELQYLIQNEAFEEAAKVRDKIRELESAQRKPEDGEEA